MAIMKINEKRLLANLHALKKFTDTPGDGVTRFSFSKQDARARKYIIKRATDAGCIVSIDALQNIRIALKTNSPDKKTVVAGSHIDTVRNGGWLDGIYGVCGALEVLETLSENIKSGVSHTDDFDTTLLDANYEMVIFAEEEGSNFGSTMTGSKFIAGFYKEKDLNKLTDDNGMTLRERLAELPATYHTIDTDDGVSIYSNEPFNENEIHWNFDSIKAMLELHIEQGPILDSEGISIGIVDAIYGMRVIEVTLDGVGNHAGATPMDIRYDALCTAAECILAAEALVKSDKDHCTVVTVGKLEVMPNCSNVIPETVRFSLEVRDKDEDKINAFTDNIIKCIHETANRRHVDCKITEHSKSRPLQLCERLKHSMEQTAIENELSYKVMDSGAVHDACMIANFADTGMIFVPSIDGRSHVPEENTNEKDLITGVQFLMDTVLDEIKTK